MYTSEKEKVFFLSHIKKTDVVLEYGSGGSTFEISKVCKKLISVEHQKKWYENIKNKLPDNVILKYCPPDKPYAEGGHCGTYEEFESYIEKPLEFGKFDIIYIDGRARNYCASICNKLGHQNTLVFVHDFNRKEYEIIHTYLEVINNVETMYKFKIKFNV